MVDATQGIFSGIIYILLDPRPIFLYNQYIIRHRSTLYTKKNKKKRVISPLFLFYPLFFYLCIVFFVILYIISRFDLHFYCECVRYLRRLNLPRRRSFCFGDDRSTILRDDFRTRFIVAPILFKSSDFFFRLRQEFLVRT